MPTTWRRWRSIRRRCIKEVRKARRRVAVASEKPGNAVWVSPVYGFAA
jgi:hypothetical protein